MVVYEALAAFTPSQDQGKIAEETPPAKAGCLRSRLV